MTLGPDLFLDALTGDLDLNLGDFAFKISVSQSIAIRLRYFKGEWFLDQDRGLPYFQEIFIKPNDMDHIMSLYRKCIVETPGVSTLDAFDYTYDNATRTLTIKWRAIVDGTEVSGADAISL